MVAHFMTFLVITFEPLKELKGPRSRGMAHGYRNAVQHHRLYQ